MYFATVPRSDVTFLRCEFTKTHFSQIQSFYRIRPHEISPDKFDYILPDYILIRSPIVRVTTQGRPDDEAMFGAPVQVTFKVDQLRMKGILIDNPRKQLCLGIVDEKNK